MERLQRERMTALATWRRAQGEPMVRFVSQLNQPTTIFQTILGLAVVAVAITYMLRSIL